MGEDTEQILGCNESLRSETRDSHEDCCIEISIGSQDKDEMASLCIALVGFEAAKA